MTIYSASLFVVDNEEILPCMYFGTVWNEDDDGTGAAGLLPSGGWASWGPVSSEVIVLTVDGVSE